MTRSPAFGVPQLDKVVGPSPRRLLLRNDAGVDGGPFLRHVASQWLRSGGEVVYLVADRAPMRALAAFAADGFDLRRSADRLHFIDAHTPRLGAPESAAYTVDPPDDPEAMLDALGAAASGHPGALLVIDSLSTLAGLVPPGALEETRGGLARAWEAFPAVSALWTDWGSDPTPALLEAFETVVRLRGVEERILTRNYFTVERRPPPGGPSRPILYRTRQPGGVYVYIPKILVTGPHDAGKSTFVHSVSDVALSAERSGTTVALDRGQVTFEGLQAEVFGTPGQERFDPLLDALAAQALAVVLMVDSTRPETFDRASAMLRKVRSRALPAVIVANKQDARGALSPEDVAARLARPEGVPVVGASARDPQSSRAVLQALIRRILEAPA